MKPNIFCCPICCELSLAVMRFWGHHMLCVGLRVCHLICNFCALFTELLIDIPRTEPLALRAIVSCNEWDDGLGKTPQDAWGTLPL